VNGKRKNIDDAGAEPEKKPAKKARKKGSAKPAAKKKGARKTSAKAASRKAPPEPKDEEVRRRAYEIYERRGSEHGRDFDDWLEAEAEVRDERHRARDEDLGDKA
jgi:hypothetical protein